MRLAAGFGLGVMLWATSCSAPAERPVAPAVGATIADGAGAASSPSSAPRASATPSVASAAPSRSTGACEDALSDHIAFYGDVDRPPPQAKQQLFMELCLALPPLFQLCASPRYQTDHEAECQPVHVVTGEKLRLWTDLFEALRDAP